MDLETNTPSLTQSTSLIRQLDQDLHGFEALPNRLSTTLSLTPELNAKIGKERLLYLPLTDVAFKAKPRCSHKP